LKLFYIIGNIRNIKQFLKDKSVSFFNKFLLVFALAYVLSPIDLIPAPILGFSLLDDAAVLFLILYYLRDYLSSYNNVNSDNGNIYENTSYRVDNDE